MKIRIFIFLCFLCCPVFADPYTINGFEFQTSSLDINKGIRLKGIGDFFYNQKLYAQAIVYYEQALEYLPIEADIVFRLGNIYQKEKLWQLSILYYEQTIQFLKKEENFGKSQFNGYLAKIRMAQVFYESRQEEKALYYVNELRKESSILISLYPEAWKEFQEYFDSIYPESPQAISK